MTFDVRRGVLIGEASSSPVETEASDLEWTEARLYQLDCLPSAKTAYLLVQFHRTTAQSDTEIEVYHGPSVEWICEELMGSDSGMTDLDIALFKAAGFDMRLSDGRGGPLLWPHPEAD